MLSQQLLAMRVFVRTVETGSFVKASGSLQVPRATTTKLVQDLERHLGVQLLQRTTRRLALTPEGSIYYERATRILAEIDEADAAVGTARSLLSGTVRVNLGSSLANLVLLPALPTFAAKHPRLHVALGVSDRTVNLIEEGVDCVIRGGRLAPSTLQARKLCELRFGTYAAPSYLARHAAPAHPRALERGHALVHYASTSTGRMAPLSFAKGTESFTVDGHGHVSVNESTAHVTALVAGLGVGQTFTFMADAAQARGALIQLFADWDAGSHPLHVLYPPTRQMSAKVRAFVDWAVEVFAAL